MLTRRRAGGERGNVALAVTVMVVLASLATVMVTRDVSEARGARRAQDRAAALTAADSAVAAAAARAVIDTNGKFELEGSTASASWRVVAIREGERWGFEVEGRAGAVARRVRVMMERPDGRRWRITSWSPAM